MRPLPAMHGLLRLDQLFAGLILPALLLESKTLACKKVAHVRPGFFREQRRHLF